jgi:tetratricopeptide (TPR) repeat protein
MTRSPSILVIVAIAAAHMPSAMAQPAAARGHSKQPTPKELDEARAHFKAAEAAKAGGEYQTAAVEYLAAYQLFEEPEFFFDTAEVYRLGGDEQNALTYYEKYLEIDPGGRGAAIARSSADQLRRQIATRQDTARRARDEDGGRKADGADSKANDGAGGKTDDGAGRKVDNGAGRMADDGAGRKADDGAGRKADDAAGHPLDDGQATTATRPGHHLRVAGIATGAVGAVALGVGAGFGFKARSLGNELSRASVFDRARYDQGRAAERHFVLCSGLGVAGVVTGAVLYYVGARAEHGAATDAALTLAPIVAPSQLTVTVSGRF